jgi:hypothetical protein
VARVQHTFENTRDEPIYVSIEPWPECFELEPRDKLTLIYDAVDTGDGLLVQFHNERELVLWPEGQIDDLQILFNGQSSEGRSWVFKHQ